MAFLKKPVLSKSNSHFETIIGSSSRIDGNLSISENIRIDGIINGNILQIEGKQITVAVANGASILGDIRADNIILSGKVVGNLFTQNMVEVLSTAEINGDINYVNISMEAGANIKGQLNKINDSTGVEAATHLVIDQVKQKSSQT
jgi:cytoskeletal protein CcmA (bactofilin family)